MAHHLVFVEDELLKGQEKVEVFKRIGLEDHIAGCDALRVSADESPCGTPGILFAWRSKGDDQIVVNKELQEWMKSADGYWVGIWKDRPPTEEQLRRPYMQKGVWVSFRDGSRWKLPVVGTIEQELALKDDGKWEFKPLRELSWYSEEIEKRRADFRVGDVDGNQVLMHVQFDALEVIELIIRALRINYRITPEVACMTRLMTTRNIQEVFGIMFDLALND